MKNPYSEDCKHENSSSFARIVKLSVNYLSGMETANKFRHNFGDVIYVFYGLSYACFRTFLWKKTLFHGSIQDLSDFLVQSQTIFFKSQTNNMKSVALRLLCVHREISCQVRNSFCLSEHLNGQCQKCDGSMMDVINLF